MTEHDTFVTMIIRADEQATAQQSCPEAEGMFTAPLSATGFPPVTHYIATGQCEPHVVAAIVAAVPDADVSDEPWPEAIARLGLQPIVEERE